MESQALRGLDSLLSTVQMPAGIPVGTLAIGKAGAINAALLATTMLGNKEPKYRQAIHEYRAKQTQAVVEAGDPRQ
jgi:5-(carboxyamino)imidazole ribonucleotide mutase